MTAGTEAERIAELEEDNKRLRRLLDQRDAPSELRHRLRSTLSLLRSVVRLSAQTTRTLPAYVAHLEDRLDALARVQGFASQHGYVDLRTLIAEELFQYGTSEGEQLLLSGPDVRLQPKAGQVLALGLHELAVNAVEHGALGTAGGRIEVSWSVTAQDPEPAVLLLWKEHRPALSASSANGGFGTEVLTRMLPYELKAETNLVFETDGLRFDMSLPLPLQVGQAGPH